MDEHIYVGYNRIRVLENKFAYLTSYGDKLICYVLTNTILSKCKEPSTTGGILMPLN